MTVGERVNKMYILFPKMPEIKEGKIDAKELIDYLKNQQLIIKAISEKIV